MTVNCKIIAQLRESRLSSLRQGPKAAVPASRPKSVVATTTQPISERYHSVQRGDTLSRLALEYYGSAQRWHDIYEANRDVIADVNEISVGTTLIIP